MRDVYVDLARYQISREAYLELKWYCRQYRQKKHIASAQLGPRAQALTGMPAGGSGSDPVAAAVIRREAAMRDVTMIERAARDVAGGAWYHSLISSCCDAVPYNHLDKLKMPSSSREAFFAARREFFWRLHRLRQDVTGGEYDDVKESDQNQP